MQSMRLCICSSKQFEETSENSLWRKNIQMQPMRLCIHSGSPFEDAFENTLWRKTIQMHPMWLFICWSRQFEETSENSLRRKAISVTLQLFIQALSCHLKTNSWEKSRKMICKTNLIFNIILHTGFEKPRTFSVFRSGPEISSLIGKIKGSFYFYFGQAWKCIFWGETVQWPTFI